MLKLRYEESDLSIYPEDVQDFLKKIIKDYDGELDSLRDSPSPKHYSASPLSMSSTPFTPLSMMRGFPSPIRKRASPIFNHMYKKIHFDLIKLPVFHGDIFEGIPIVLCENGHANFLSCNTKEKMLCKKCKKCLDCDLCHKIDVKKSTKKTIKHVYTPDYLKVDFLYTKIPSLNVGSNVTIPCDHENGFSCSFSGYLKISKIDNVILNTEQISDLIQLGPIPGIFTLESKTQV